MPFLTVTRTVVDAIAASASRAAPREACGLLLGRGSRIDALSETVNVAPDPLRHFEIDPAALIAAHKAERAGGQQLIGYFHSHPSGLPEPSATDQAQAARDGRVWAIATPAGEIGWFVSEEDGFARLCPQILPELP
ncbi:M67 family metallopeptidase [Croceicoccus marinus]|uniref:M67 family metallopeptidase n=1 Tax=Croceicoccus marinus TaxID=450378 RepID=UPI000A967D20